jgi:hypothetical protein
MGITVKRAAVANFPTFPKADTTFDTANTTVRS